MLEKHMQDSFQIIYQLLRLHTPELEDPNRYTDKSTNTSYLKYKGCDRNYKKTQITKHTTKKASP
ncbi:hypothetical protein Hanom_Chr17g01545911 [Helianthus anomalus]